MANIQDLAAFDGTNGAQPSGDLIADASGTLYGTTASGGDANSDGTVFALAKDPTSATGYSTTLVPVVVFNGTDGSNPFGSLITDAAGNLYGTTQAGGSAGDGTVFEITKDATSSTGYSSTPTTIASFNGTNGSAPEGSLIADAAGNLFGTASGGGASGDGTVFEIAKTSTGYSSTATTLVSFNGVVNGLGPRGSLITDAAGDLFGTTQKLGPAAQGQIGQGTVFEIAKDPTSATGYSSTPTTLVSFNSTNGGSPDGSLVADAAGNLYGTTQTGGQDGYGTVFEIAKTSTGYNSTPTTLASFISENGASPEGSLIFDAAGNLYGTTSSGGPDRAGTVFELAKDPTSATGYSSTPTTLASFNSNNGNDPVGSLIADASGNLYGTTSLQGQPGQSAGTVFEVTNTGFVTCFVTGTLIRTRRGDVPVENLRVGDVAVTASGAARPITWIGHRRLGCAGEMLPHGQQPVRVRAHAFGPGLPRRDLFLSPGHPVLVGADDDGMGGHLVPIMCLVNGTTIERVRVQTVTYWHVELDAHDILLAEGLPAESYLDWGDRVFFEENANHALANPDFVVPGLGRRCRPVAIDGTVVEAERRRLDQVFAMSLAQQCAWPGEDAASSHLS